MRKITDFIVNRRHIILILFVLLTIISAIASSKVKINYDMAQYLPDTSETRIGMDIMEEEFSDVQSSTLNIMFENLEEEQKAQIKTQLEEIEGIDSVDYEPTEEYNKENYTLYIITVDDKSDSQLASDVYDRVLDKYKDYTIYTSGAISETNKTVLPVWIIVLAIACALVILIIMCESYVEPFLFLTAILMAVVLNKGTNIIFGTISNITNSIAMILQLALSMDYSIMLMNRYEQEKQTSKDTVTAMKNALYKAFQAISSSSVTTIVGLLCLVFMSFKIGKDLGFVLAKGVLFSLICIFFVLPSLILMFDKLIVKTKKRTPNINLTKLGKFSYKVRYVAIPLFMVVFIGSFMLKGNLGIDYTDSQIDKISEVFEENNQMAIIYKNNQESKIATHLSNLENKEKVDEVLAYGNTIGEKLAYNNLNEKLNELGSDVNIEDYLLKILYYDYYNPEDNNKLTFNEFVKFIEEEAYNNKELSKEIDAETRSNITRLKNFITSDAMNQKKTENEISSILKIDESKIDDILIYYLSKNNNVQLNLNNFVTFMNNEVIKDKKYGAKINQNEKTRLNTLSKYTNKQTIQSKMKSNQMAKLFAIDETSMKDLYKYYISVNDINTKMTISDFVTFVLNNVITDSNYSSSFDETTKQNLKLLSTFSNIDVITRKMDSKSMSSLFGMDEMSVNQVYYIYAISTSKAQTNTEKTPTSEEQTSTSVEQAPINPEKVQMTPIEFAKFILGNETIKSTIDKVTISKLQLVSNVMQSTIDKTMYSYTELSKIIGIESATTKNIYILNISSKDSTTLTPQEFVSFVLKHKNDKQLEGKITATTISDLDLVNKVMNGVISNKKYSSVELSSLLGIDKDNLKLIYGLYSFKHINTSPKLSIKEFVNFLLNDVVKNKEYSSNFTKEQITKLNTVNGIMNDSLKGIKYTSGEIFAILSTLTDNVEKNTVEVLYTYYGSNKQYDETWQLTVEEFVNFLNDKILQDERFTDFIEEDMRKDIIDAKQQISDAKELIVGDNYSRVVLNTKLQSEGKETFEFIQNVKNELKEDVEDYYVIGDSPMAYEMSQSFDNELNFITIITMISIFIVVVITFKSIIKPVILVLIIQCAVYLTMGILSFTGENVYFIAILIVQSILMGATIDYAILYTSYYLENRKEKSIKESVIDSYNRSIHTILTSSSILIIVTLIIANFASAITAKICKTISEGTICSTVLILLLLPAVLAAWDKEKRDFRDAP